MTPYMNLVFLFIPRRPILSELPALKVLIRKTYLAQNTNASITKVSDTLNDQSKL